MLTFCNLNPHLLTGIGGRSLTSLQRAILVPSSTCGNSMEIQFRRQKATKSVPYPKLDEYALKAINQKEKGRIYDKKPFKFYCEKGKSYLWCTCGWSKSQPFCDGHHKNPHFRIKLKPLVFIAPESREYWFCNCKQTSSRPFCDGTHREQAIQDAIKS